MFMADVVINRRTCGVAQQDSSPCFPCKSGIPRTAYHGTFFSRRAHWTWVTPLSLKGKQQKQSNLVTGCHYSVLSFCWNSRGEWYVMGATVEMKMVTSVSKTLSTYLWGGKIRFIWLYLAVFASIQCAMWGKSICAPMTLATPECPALYSKVKWEWGNKVMVKMAFTFLTKRTTVRCSSNI